MARERFIGYASTPPAIGEAIENAARIFGTKIAKHIVRTWPQVFEYGEIIDTNVFSTIDTSELCYFDVTVPNFNVLYEAGYAIGRGKPVIPLVNIAVEGAGKFLQEIGIFDNVGFANYSNSTNLLPIIEKDEVPRPIVSPAQGINLAQPMYVLQPKIANERFSKMITSLSEIGIQFRNFDPSEDSRIAVRDALKNIEESISVLCPIAPGDLTDSQNHNLRAAFLGGLAAGKDKALLFLNMSEANLPLDIRDVGKRAESLEAVETKVREFALRSLTSLQAVGNQPTPTIERKSIEFVSLGNSAAENEARRLPEYFIETPAFRETVSGHARVVIGRKGSGKTAIFSMAQRALVQSRKDLVLALKPEGYQLRKFKDRLIGLLQEGTKEHTISAFWEYLLLLEICHKCIESDAKYFGRDHDISEMLPSLQRKYADDPYVREGDFSERTAKLLDDLDARLSQGPADRTYLSRQQITELLYHHDIQALRKDLVDYLSLKDSVVILIDNLDKAWDPRGVSADDILMLRSLLEAGRKFERTLAPHDINSFCVVFLRNDIYELLVDQTPDRGKEAKVAIDWTDRDYLKTVLNKRLRTTNPPTNWSSIAVSHVDGKGSLDWVLDRCLMRPRYLLDFVSRCLGVAASHGHARIQESDFKSAYGSFSLDVLVSTNLEVRDVKPSFYDTIFALQNLRANTSRIDIGLGLVGRGFPEEKHDEIIDLLVWYGVLGCVGENGRPKYIYEVEYNSHVLDQLRVNRGGDEEIFQVNPAFWPALNIDERGEAGPSIRLL